ncbi:DUF3788 family protein [Candidatus Thorarchaeota archaeon]|nr:MAG: DUF3788 family protein [Candidatus Thorarchaeota archaeon]
MVIFVVKEKESDISREPTDDEILEFLGNKAGKMWMRIKKYIDENYEFEPIRENKDLDATIRYKRSGKTLLTFYPKKNELTVLIIFGKNEVQKFEQLKNDFSSETVDIFMNTKQYHDGRWLHFKIPPFNQFDDIQTLLAIKKQPAHSLD